MDTCRKGRAPADGVVDGAKNRRSSGPARVRAYYLRRKAHRVTELLSARYGSPRHDNKADPLDELVFILLSQMTTHWSFGRVFDRLKFRFPSWDTAVEAGVPAVAEAIKDAGLSGQKAPRIIEILKRLRVDFGAVTLDPLRSMDDAAAELYLTSLPGVGIKTAKCVLMYSLGRPVLPVDTHLRRLAVRLGLLHERTPQASIHSALQTAVAPEDRYLLHVTAISHGRQVCLARAPRCTACVLARLCCFRVARNSRPATDGRTRRSTPRS